jgi:hypothetical protein
MGTTTIVTALLDSVRRHAEAQGLSVMELCFYADINYSTWHRWTTGKMMPRVANIDKLLNTKAPAKARRAAQ